MHKRPLGIERSVMTASLAVIACWGCSGGSNSTGGGAGGLGGAASTGGAMSSNAPMGGTTVGAGGAQLGGVPQTSGNMAQGGSNAAGGSSAMGGQGAAGGASATGGQSAAGGSGATGGQRAAGGASATGGQSAAGGSNATGGKTVTGTSLATGGSEKATGGALTTGGADTGGTKAISGGAPNTGGSVPGGTTGVGGTTGTGGGNSSVSCPSTAMKSGSTDQTLKVGTLDRKYRLHIPTGYTGTKPLAVVFDFHGLGGTAVGQESGNGWKAKADSVGFIMVYPESYNSNNSWDAGMCCQDAQHNSIDDVAFVRAIITQLKETACVDPKRIYVTGCSNGGGMSYKIACDAADVIAAAAPVDFRCVYGGTTASPSCEGCKPSRPISITHFDNTGDTQLVPYAGGMTGFAADCPPNQSCTGMGFPSADVNFSTWQTLDGCTGSTSTLTGHAACKTNSACQDGVQVTMCVQQGGGHCSNYTSLGIVDIAWELFQKESLP